MTATPPNGAFFIFTLTYYTKIENKPTIFRKSLLCSMIYAILTYISYLTIKEYRHK